MLYDISWSFQRKADVTATSNFILLSSADDVPAPAQDYTAPDGVTESPKRPRPVPVRQQDRFARRRDAFAARAKPTRR